MTLPIFKKSGGSNAVDVDATAGYVRAFGMAGSAVDGSNAIPVTIPVTQAGRVVRKWVPTSRNLAITDFDGSWLTSTSSGSTIITITTFATLGITRDPTTTVEWQFRVDIGGTGALIVSPVDGTVTIHDPKGLFDPSGELVRYSGPWTFTTCGAGDNEWMVS